MGAEAGRRARRAWPNPDSRGHTTTSTTVQTGIRHCNPLPLVSFRLVVHLERTVIPCSLWSHALCSAGGLMRLQNRSVPNLHLPDQSPEPVPPLPQSQYDPTQVLDRFHAMHLSEQPPRAGSAMSYRTAPNGVGYAQEPPQRAGTSMSMRSNYSSASAPAPAPAPRHANSLPVSPAQHRPPRGSAVAYRPDGVATNDDVSAHPITEEDEDPYAGTEETASVYGTAQQGERASMYSQQSGDSQYYANPAAYAAQAQQWQQPAYGGYQQYQQYQEQDPNAQYQGQGQNAQYQGQGQNAQYHGQYQGQGQNDAYYSAAPDAMGGQQAAYAPPPQGYPQMASQYQPQRAYAQSVHSLASSRSVPSMAPSMASTGSGGSYAPEQGAPRRPVDVGDDDDIALRPAAQRQNTAALTNLATAKTKAVDLSAPPYTKQYIDEYRQRIKADPDPEAHFAYAKYLVEAAKKVGADAKDQRTVKKYRETLLGEALKVIRRLATSGTPYDEAQFFLANCYGTGLLGLQVDHERAYHLYLQAAKQNNAAAAYRVAVCNEIGAGTRKEPARAAAFYRKAASLGDTAAMYKLGMILLEGQLGEAPNERDAIGWLKRAAEQADEANPHALHELGLLHDNPNARLVPYDPVYARRLFVQAGQLGYTHSQYRLGLAYEHGTPACPADPRRSIAWYTKAAEKAHSEAELALSGWYLTGAEGVLKQSDSEAYLWARRAANKGLSKAEYAVGYYAEIGIGIKQDIEFAKRWYMRAAGACSFLLEGFLHADPTMTAQGNKRAMNRLTEIKRGTNKKGAARPTRQQAKDGDCVIS
jgi:TPR repeat protein